METAKKEILNCKKEEIIVNKWKAIRLRCEYLEDPIGIDVCYPRFYWNCEGGKRQVAYQIICTSDGKTIWDSGKVESSSMTHIVYNGEPLQSRQRVYWQVNLWDENGLKGISNQAFFEMGLMEQSDWKANWMSGNYIIQKGVRYPVDYFKKEFKVKKNLRKARLYATACGIYEVQFNGKRVGNFVLAPGSTDYRKRVNYQTYDVVDLLQTGNNMITVELGDGWYRGGRDDDTETTYGKQTKCLIQLELHYADGTTEYLCSNDSFKWSDDGPVGYNDMKNGEVFEAYKTPTYSGTAVKVLHNVVPTASNSVFVVEKERFSPKLTTTPCGNKVLDFGQNIAGYLEFHIMAGCNDKIKLRFGEILDELGEFTQKSIQMPDTKNPIRQEIIYHCKDGENQYKSKFCVFGFQYVLVETSLDINTEDFTAVAVYSDMEVTGEFSCSNPLVTKLYQNTLWSMKGNFLDVPTDCPTRERQGWLGDAQIFAITGSYMMDTSAFYLKWLRDIKDELNPDHCPNMIVPTPHLHFLAKKLNGSVGWADCIVLLPYRYYKMYGDIRILEQYYLVMHNYAGFLIKRANKGFFKEMNNPFKKYACTKGMHYGEWFEPDPYRGTAMDVFKSHTEEATAYLSYTMGHLVEIAELLGKTEDAKLYREYEQGAKKAYQFMFAKNNDIKTDRQAKLLRPLKMNLLNEQTTKNVQKRFIDVMIKNNYKIGTGFLSTPFMLQYLTENGEPELAYKVLEQEENPGWLYEVKQGATTVWERWDGTDSRNHYSPGSVCEWMFHTICGIQIAGENRFVIEPQPGGTLSYAKATYKSLYGTVSCAWEKQYKKTQYTIKVPENTIATVKIAGMDTVELEAGTYSYELVNKLSAVSEQLFEMTYGLNL